MSQRSFSGNGNAREVAQMIIEEVQKAGVSNTLVDSCAREIDGITAVTMVFERYYYRAQNRASLSVMIIGDSNGNVTIDAIGAGGGQGVFFAFSWGAEENFVGMLESVLLKRGFN